MRVLFTCRPGDGHYYPMRPVLDALVAAGDEVAVATGEPLARDVEAEGITVFRVGLDGGDPILDHHRQIAAGLPAFDIRRYAFAEWFVGAELPPRLHDLDAVLTSFEPDLVVHETAEFAGPLIAASRHIPYATHGFGPLLQPDVALAAGAAAAPMWRKLGLEPHPRAGLYEHLYLDICPPSMQIPAIKDLSVVQPIGRAAQPSAAHLSWIGELTNRPIVYVTFGTVYNRDASVFRTVLEGLSDENVNVVVTVGRNNDPSMLGAQPQNVLVHRFVPQALLLPHCSAVVTHGGAGSMLGALSCGLPLLVVPRGADQFYNAERVRVAGAGLTLAPTEFASAAVRACVRELLDEPSFRDAAKRIRAEFDAMPDPAAIRPRLVALATPG